MKPVVWATHELPLPLVLEIETIADYACIQSLFKGKRSQTMQKVLKSGAGWRIGWNPDREYPGLVGSDDWALELTALELADFCRLLEKLVENMRSMQAELMDAESIACESESELVWLQVAGIPDKYSLRLILNTGRSCEGNWASEALPDLVAAVGNLNFF